MAGFDYTIDFLRYPDRCVFLWEEGQNIKADRNRGGRDQCFNLGEVCL